MSLDEGRRQDAGITQFVVQAGAIAIGLLAAVFAVVDLAQNRQISLLTVIGVFGLVLSVAMAPMLLLCGCASSGNAAGTGSPSGRSESFGPRALSARSRVVPAGWPKR